MTRSLILAAAGILLSFIPLLAQITPGKNGPDPGLLAKPDEWLSNRLDPKIDSWEHGEITALDATKGEMSINGFNMPYATAFARMLREIHDCTANIAETSDKLAMEFEIRQNWESRLEAAKKESPGQSLTLDIRTPEGRVVDVEKENQVADIDYLHKDPDVGFLPVPQYPRSGVLAAPVIGGPNVARSPDPSGPNQLSFDDLHVGDHVIVGYDSGLIHNDGYVVIRVAENTHAIRPESK